MAYKQFLGKQGSSMFILRNRITNTTISSVVIPNTCPSIDIIPVGEVPQNFRGDNIDMVKGVSFKVSIDIINVESTDNIWHKIFTLINQINLLRANKLTHALKMYPLYDANMSGNWGIDVIPSEQISSDNIKKFINTAQKITMAFVSKYAVQDIPISFQNIDSDTTVIIKTPGHIIQVL